GMYRTWFAASRFDELSTLFKATFVGIFILFFGIFIDDYLKGVDSASRILIFIYWGFLFFLVGIGRLVIRSVQRNLLIKGIGRRCALIVGYNEKAFEVFDTLTQHRGLGIDPEAFVAVHNENMGRSYKNVKVEGTVNNLN